ncbi:hypothetical protein [Pseudomonas chlororaphis]|uniref:hypothetical protein n=1 Tax=Pseudomonas chlororaphis TaxID=587753 RepID=UPI000B01F50C
MIEVAMKYLKLASLLLVATTLFGCATSRSVVGIDGPEVASGNGQKVVINVLDERRFEADPRSADIPSLKNGEIDDKAITERAIARKRNSYGMGLGDVLLPEGADCQEHRRSLWQSRLSSGAEHRASAGRQDHHRACGRVLVMDVAGCVLRCGEQQIAPEGGHR